MTKYRLSLLLAALLCAPLAAQSQSADPCAALSGLKIGGIEITKAALVSAGTTVPPPYPGAPSIGPLPAHCRVDGVINRRKGVDGQEFGIGFALAMPEHAAWNGDFMMQGGGGGNGIIAYPAGANYAGDKPALSRGFAVASTDTGHKAKTGAFDFSFMRDQQAYLDFAFLANAEVAGSGEADHRNLLRKPAAYSYFVGCSTGGREGMILSQRYPTVFNGIVSGDPAMRTGLSNLAIGQWIPVAYNQAAPKDASGKPQIDKFLTDDDRKLFMDALMKQVRRERRRSRRHDLRSSRLRLRSRGPRLQGRPDQCMHRARENRRHQESLRRTEECIRHAGLSWLPLRCGYRIKRNGAGPARPWDRGIFGPYTTATELDVDKAALHASDPLVEPASTNLSTFSLSGGKLIFFHGDSDPWFSPLDTLAYYKSLEETNSGAEKVASWSRIFLVPGMAHCGGGPSLDQFDMLSAVVSWVEKGTAPDSVIATGQAFPGRSRPLCAYPKHAQYTGSGDTQDASNFRCQLQR